MIQKYYEADIILNLIQRKQRLDMINKLFKDIIRQPYSRIHTTVCFGFNAYILSETLFYSIH